MPKEWLGGTDGPIVQETRSEIRCFSPEGHRGSAVLIHTLLVIAAVLVILWFLFHASIGLANLIWLLIAILVVLWLVGLFRRRSTP